MKKILAIIVSISYLTACSCFTGTRQKVTVMTNVPTAEIYANGERVGQGTTAEFRVKRNKNVQIMVKADGYYPAYKSIDTQLSATGILDIIGIFFFIIPFVGLLTPGSKTLEQNNVAIELVPNPAIQK